MTTTATHIHAALLIQFPDSKPITVGTVSIPITLETGNKHPAPDHQL